MSHLFRSEAVTNATRLEGEVVLAAPLSLYVLGLSLTGVILAAVLFVATATYARKANVTGWLVPDQGFIRAAAPAGGGLIAGLFISEGERVEAGHRLAEIQ